MQEYSFPRVTPSIFSPPSFLPLNASLFPALAIVLFPIFRLSFHLSFDDHESLTFSSSSFSSFFEKRRDERGDEEIRGSCLRVKYQQPCAIDDISRLLFQVTRISWDWRKIGRRNNSFARKDGGEKAGDASAMKIRRVSADYTTRRASRVVLSRQLSETLPANSLVFGLSVFSQGLLVPDRRYLLTSEKYYSKYFRSSNSPLRVSFSNGEGRIRKKRNSLSIDITTLFSSLP